MNTDWRTLATKAAQHAFADAQARLDEGDYPPSEEGRKQMAVDEQRARWYDDNVLGSAQDEYVRQGEQAEFDARFPEPPDGSRIEWENSNGIVRGAFRDDQAEGNGDWWLYGNGRDVYPWRHLVAEFELRMDDLTFLVPKEG